MIDVSGLTKRYGERTAVSALSFTVGPGEVLGLVGPNGAGKTTTLRCVAGIVPPSAGAIRVGGHDLAADPIAAKKTLAFLPDEPRLFDYLSVRQHLELAARIYGVPAPAARVDALLRAMDLEERADLLPGELSRGMKQKTVLACGFVHSPRAMLFDEPLTGLDPLAIRATKKQIVDAARAGAAIVISSHLLHLLEEVCTHVLIVRRGSSVTHDTLDGLRARHEGRGLEEIFVELLGDEAEG